MAPIQREWTIGENLVRFEPPDLLHIKFKGPCTLEEARIMVDLARELASVQPFFVLGDMADAGTLDAEARHYFSEHWQSEWALGLVYFQARLLHKAVVLGLRLAIELTRSEKSPMMGKIHFAPTREKAEALLAELREHPDDPGLADRE